MLRSNRNPSFPRLFSGLFSMRQGCSLTKIRKEGLSNRPQELCAQDVLVCGTGCGREPEYEEQRKKT